MPTITVFSAPYCREEEVVSSLVNDMRLNIVRDRQIIAQASEKYEIAEDKFYKALFGKTSVFNKFTKEKQRCIACYKSVLAAHFLKHDLLLIGFGGFLIPKGLTHVLKVCLTADLSYRLEIAAQQHHLNANDLNKLISQEDESRYRWTEYVVHQGPWESSLYDILISMDKSSVDEAASIIRSYAKRAVTLPNKESLLAAENFALTADIEAELSLRGWIVRAKFIQDKLVIRLEKNIMRTEKLEGDLKSIMENLVEDVEYEIQAGPDMFETDVYRPFDSETPSKVLLVDDEKRYAQKLSDRLRMREMGTAVVYNGEEALELIEEDEPEVVILDLMLPEIDGIQVLSLIKRSHANLPVIILSGGGQEKELRQCAQMGAFACLQKPVDIKKLTETIRRAYSEKQTASLTGKEQGQREEQL
ncbi:response regulator [Desulfonatronovibrio magnus]|uniref:response regulator n=1 Tax=Desulfonatronovibrio magnus TaxID=698827 RepID=UPI0005EB8161|nr:response regulator [Desulfonatronovibrio magnus]